MNKQVAKNVFKQHLNALCSVVEFSLQEKLHYSNYTY